VPDARSFDWIVTVIEPVPIAVVTTTTLTPR
jgi:hypothetical protein